jgi:large subunit ribosomal protein L27
MASIFHQQVRHATKKGGGSTRNGRDSIGRRLGVKKFGGEVVIPGNIIIRQRGTKYRPGENTGLGKDHTIFAKKEGWVRFEFDRTYKRQVVHVTEINPNIA